MPVQTAVALGVTVLAVGYIGRLASKAVQEYEAVEGQAADSSAAADDTVP